MVTQELVSILIPTYNRKDLVVRAIESALAQTYKNIEVIVSDNCSEDGTVKFLQMLYGKNNKVRIFKNLKNLGPVKNWINCLNKCSGEYVKLLFSDDTIEYNYIEESVKFLSDESIGLVYSPVIIENNFKKRFYYQTYKKSMKILSRKIRDRFILDLNVPVSPGAALFRREDLLESIKLEIPNSKGKNFNLFGAGTDLNIYFEILKKYKYIYYLDSTRCYFFGHKSSFTISNNLDFYYKTVRLNHIIDTVNFPKNFIYSILIHLKITKIFNYLSPFFNKI